MRRLLIGVLVNVGVQLCRWGVSLAGQGHVDVEAHSKPKIEVGPLPELNHFPWGKILKALGIGIFISLFLLGLYDIAKSIREASQSIVTELREEHHDNKMFR